MRRALFTSTTSLCLFMAVAACSSVQSGTPSSSWGGKVLSTGGNACTVEWAQYRAELGHRYNGQCAGMENEELIAQIHADMNAIYDSEKRQQSYRESDKFYGKVSADLEADRAQLEGYRALRPQMDEATRKKYDDAVARTDNAIDVLDAASDINKTEMAAAKAKTRKLRADQMGRAFETLADKPPEYWREELGKAGYSEEQQDQIIAFFSKLGGLGRKAGTAQDASYGATAPASAKP